MQEGLRQSKSKVNQLPSPFAFFAKVVVGNREYSDIKKDLHTIACRSLNELDLWK